MAKAREILGYYSNSNKIRVFTKEVFTKEVFTKLKKVNLIKNHFKTNPNQKKEKTDSSLPAPIWREAARPDPEKTKKSPPPIWTILHYMLR
jgi:hypothetical protein